MKTNRELYAHTRHRRAAARRARARLGAAHARDARRRRRPERAAVACAGARTAAEEVTRANIVSARVRVSRRFDARALDKDKPLYFFAKIGYVRQSARVTGVGYA